VSAPEAARFFLALSDPTRLALLAVLRDGERPVGDLVDALGCPQPKVSRHLKVLKDARLVRARRDGRNIHYTLAPPRAWPEEARAWIERLDAGLLPQAMSGAPPRRAAGEPSPPAAPAPPAAEMEDFLL
jgi:DNA-binding transcriptional ArsR family regulator